MIAFYYLRETDLRETEIMARESAASIVMM